MPGSGSIGVLSVSSAASRADGRGRPDCRVPVLVWRRSHRRSRNRRADHLLVDAGTELGHGAGLPGPHRDCQSTLRSSDSPPEPSAPFCMGWSQEGSACGTTMATSPGSCGPSASSASASRAQPSAPSYGVLTGGFEASFMGGFYGALIGGGVLGGIAALLSHHLRWPTLAEIGRSRQS